ncbi:hypothetical protein D3C78_1335860 [compost metagenome]
MEHQPASGRTARTGRVAVPVWPAPRADAAMPARLLARVAGRGMVAAVLARAGSGAGAFAFADSRRRVDAPARGADLALSPPARLAYVAVAGRGADCRRAPAVIAVDRPARNAQRFAADPDRRVDARAHLPRDLALSHQHRLAAARACAGFPAGELARPASDLVSAAVRGQPLATARPAR